MQSYISRNIEGSSCNGQVRTWCDAWDDVTLGRCWVGALFQRDMANVFMNEQCPRYTCGKSEN